MSAAQLFEELSELSDLSCNTTAIEQHASSANISEVCSPNVISVRITDLWDRTIENENQQTSATESYGRSELYEDEQVINEALALETSGIRVM